MKVLFTLLFSLLLLSSYAQENITGSITHDGLTREYILYIPDSYQAGNPMIMNFHGYTSSNTEQLFYGDFRSIADTAGFLILCPQGTVDNVGNTHWNVGWGTSSVDDVGFVSALIDSLHAAYDFNLDRVYSTGMSNGGFLSYVLACQLSERIAAIASVTGTMNIGSFASCNSLHPMPVMEIHGTQDATVPYNGAAFWIEGTEDVVAYWAEFNGISNAPVISPVPDIDPNDGCTAEHWVYANGDNGAEVELYKILGGAHTWPGSAFVLGTTNNDFDASTEIWRFFSQYDINGLMEPTGIVELSESPLRIYPNPVSSLLHLEWDYGAAYYRLLDEKGATLQEGMLKSGLQSFDLSARAPGHYFLVTENRSFKFIKE
jgi:polyhydroxybutyrate depolymerase